MKSLILIALAWLLAALSGVKRYVRGVLRGFRHLRFPEALTLLTRPTVARGFAYSLGGADVAGPRGTGNVEERTLELDMSERIMELEPNSTPLLVLSKRADSEVAINPDYSWWEDELNARFGSVDGIHDGTTTTIAVDDGSIWRADDLAFNTATGEIFRVVSIATDDLTVVRGVGGGNVAMADGEELIKIGSAAEEGALDKAARSKNPVEVNNHCQIFREPVDSTATKRSTKDKTRPQDWERQLNHAGIEHAKDIEYAAMFGKPSKDTTGTHPRRTTGGFNHFATQNISDVGGAMTEQEFFNALTPTFRFGSDTRLAACSSNAVDIMTSYPRSKIQVNNPDPSHTYGIRVVQIISPQGNINVVTHWLMEGAEFSEQIWLVDLMNMAYRYLHGADGSRDTHVRHDIQAPGQDGKKDEYLSECGFIVAQAKTHGKIVNITS